MSVYVDPLRPCDPNTHWAWSTSCHMTADTQDELHAMGRRLGLNRNWFHADAVIPHYDLTKGKRALAVRYGATQLTLSEAGSRIREARLSAKPEGNCRCST